MSGQITLPDGQPLDLKYFVEWRPWLWEKPAEMMLGFLGNLKGKRVLEIGGRAGRMTSLMALHGAEVTMMEMGELETARKEIGKWDVADQVRLVQTKGDFDEIAGETYDVIFTKSVLWCIEHLSEFLDQIQVHLADGGKVAFLENYRGSSILLWLRRNLVRRGRFSYEHKYFGIRPDQLQLFRRRFANVRIRRYRWLVYTIFGEKIQEPVREE